MLLAFVLAFAAADAAPAAQPTAAKEERKICRYVEAVSGTRMGGKRVCKTAAEWKAQDQGLDTSKLRQISGQ